MSTDDNGRIVHVRPQRSNVELLARKRPPWKLLINRDWKKRKPVLAPKSDRLSDDDEYMLCEQKMWEWDSFSEIRLVELQEIHDPGDVYDELAKLRARYYKRWGIDVYLRRHGRMA